MWHSKHNFSFNSYDFWLLSKKIDYLTIFLLNLFGNLDASEFFARAKKFGFLQFFRVLTRKNSNFYSLRVPDPKKPEP